MLTQLCFGVVITALAATAAVQEVHVFTAFAMVGASFGVFCAFAWTEDKDSNRVKAARAIVGLVFGVLVPRGAEYSFEWFRNLMVDPLVIVGVSFSAAIMSYSVMYRFFRLIDKRSPGIARGLAKVAEEYAGIKEDKPDGKG